MLHDGCMSPEGQRPHTCAKTLYEVRAVSDVTTIFEPRTRSIPVPWGTGLMSDLVLYQRIRHTHVVLERFLEEKSDAPAPRKSWAGLVTTAIRQGRTSRDGQEKICSK